MGEMLTRNGSRTEVLADLELLAAFEFHRDGGTRGAGHHFHAKHVDAFVVLEGEVEILTAGDSLTLSAGDAVAVPPGVVHGFNNLPPGPVRLLNFHAPSYRFVEYLRRQYAREQTDPAEFDQHPPEDAPGGDPVVSRSGEGERFDRGNGFVTVRFDLPELSLIEIEFEPSFQVPPHSHDDHVDSFYVVEGEVEFALTDGPLRAGPGTFLAAAPGMQHGFRTDDPGSARVLNFHAPDAGFADWVRSPR